MDKPTIFISHIVEEKELAQTFKNEIERSFLGLVNLFVSSDANSIKLGRNWLDEITRGLRGCKALIVFCSPYSIHRPWINFECGAGWARNIPIAPLCHSGLHPADLPLPIRLLQGMEANDAGKISEVFRLIAEQLNSAMPPFDANGLASKVRQFEMAYVEENEIQVHLSAINEEGPNVIDALCHVQVELRTHIENLPERSVNSIRPHLKALKQAGHLEWSYAVNSMMFAEAGSSGGGNYGVLTVVLGKRLVDGLKSFASGRPS